jgi:hypothetical protein
MGFKKLLHQKIEISLFVILVMCQGPFDGYLKQFGQ